MKIRYPISILCIGTLIALAQLPTMPTTTAVVIGPRLRHTNTPPATITLAWSTTEPAYDGSGGQSDWTVAAQIISGCDDTSFNSTNVLWPYTNSYTTTNGPDAVTPVYYTVTQISALGMVSAPALSVSSMRSNWLCLTRPSTNSSRLRFWVGTNNWTIQCSQTGTNLWAPPVSANLTTNLPPGDMSHVWDVSVISPGTGPTYYRLKLP